MERDVERLAGAVRPAARGAAARRLQQAGAVLLRAVMAVLSLLFLINVGAARVADAGDRKRLQFLNFMSMMSLWRSYGLGGDVLAKLGNVSLVLIILHCASLVAVLVCNYVGRMQVARHIYLLGLCLVLAFFTHIFRGDAELHVAFPLAGAYSVGLFSQQDSVLRWFYILLSFAFGLLVIGSPVGFSSSTQEMALRAQFPLMFVFIVGMFLFFWHQIERATVQLEETAVVLKANVVRKERAENTALAAVGAKTAFIENVSRELRAPVNGILGAAELLLGLRLDAEQREVAELLYSSGRGLLDIVNDVLDYTRIESDSMELVAERFSLVEVMESAVDLVSFLAGKKCLHLLTSASDIVPPFVLGDAQRLRQVMVNLLGNAVKFTSHGEICLSVDVAGSNSDEDCVSLHFVCADTGIGIPANRLESVFETFTQAEQSTARKFGGSGLGLTISRRLVEMMGGRMWCTSQLGVGSQFHFTVQLMVSSAGAVSGGALGAPSIAPPSAAAGPASLTSSALPSSAATRHNSSGRDLFGSSGAVTQLPVPLVSTTFVVLTRCEQLYESMVRTLLQRGAIPYRARSVAECERQCAAHGADAVIVDALLCDRPPMAAVYAAQRLRSVTHPPPRIILYSYMLHRPRSWRDSFDTVLTAPLKRGSLAALLRAFERRTLMERGGVVGGGGGIGWLNGSGSLDGASSSEGPLSGRLTELALPDVQLRSTDDTLRTLAPGAGRSGSSASGSSSSKRDSPAHSDAQPVHVPLQQYLHAGSIQQQQQQQQLLQQQFQYDSPPDPLEVSLHAASVLLADDANSNCVVMRGMLKKLGYHCEVVHNGEDAVRRCMSGHFDVVLLDYEMPVTNGVEAARILRQRGFNKYIAILTAHSDLEESSWLAVGVNACWMKPISMSTIQAIMEQAALTDRRAPPVPPFRMRSAPRS